MSIATTLSDAIAYLCHPLRGNFYAFCINGLQKVYTYAAPTFQVSRQGHRYVLEMNPDFAQKMDFATTVMLIEHEVAHILLGHIPRTAALAALFTGDPKETLYFHMAWPIAVDAAVHELIRDNHAKECFEGFVLAERYELPRGKHYEFYLHALMERFREEIPEPQKLMQDIVDHLKDQIEKAGGMSAGSMMQQLIDAVDKARGDDSGADAGADSGAGSGADADASTDAASHGNDAGDGVSDASDGDMSPFERQIRKTLIEGILSHLSQYLQPAPDVADQSHLDRHATDIARNAKKAFDRSTKGRGTMPGQLAELVEALLRPPSVPYTEILRSLAVAALRSKRTRGMQRVSKHRAALQRFLQGRVSFARRVPLFPGSMRDIKFRVYFIIDTSGSMSFEDLCEAYTEMQLLQKTGVDMEMHVLYVDAGIAREYVVGVDDQLDPNMVGRGGTDFEVTFKHIAEKREHVDLVVYATDGWAPAPTTQLPCPVIWLLTKGGRPVVTGQAGHHTVHMRPYSSANEQAA